MKNIAIIGLGNISIKYKEALKARKDFNLVGLVDIKENALGIKHYPNVLFFSTLKELFDNVKVDYLIIATPPSTHFKIIKQAFLNKVNVFVEKVVALKMEEIKELKSLQKEFNTKLIPIYHWLYGNEVLALKDFNIDINDLLKIEVIVFENKLNEYDTVDDKYASLNGAVIDAYPNIFSLIEGAFMPLDKAELYKISYDVSKYSPDIKKCNLTAFNKHVTLGLMVNWSKKEEMKKTILTFYNRTKLIIDHLNQSIEYNGKIYNYEKEDRLVSHYKNFFLREDLFEDNINWLNIHKALFGLIKRTSH